MNEEQHKRLEEIRLTFGPWVKLADPHSPELLHRAFSAIAFLLEMHTQLENRLVFSVALQLWREDNEPHTTPYDFVSEARKALEIPE